MQDSVHDTYSTFVCIITLPMAVSSLFLENHYPDIKALMAKDLHEALKSIGGIEGLLIMDRLKCCVLTDPGALRLYSFICYCMLTVR